VKVFVTLCTLNRACTDIFSRGLIWASPAAPRQVDDGVRRSKTAPGAFAVETSRESEAWSRASRLGGLLLAAPVDAITLSDTTQARQADSERMDLLER